MSLPPAIPGSMIGLGGTPPAGFERAEDESQAQAPQGGEQEAPEQDPGQSVALHIMSALGGAAGKPMDWAKGVLSGGLAAAANVGKVPAGAGALYGAAKGAQGVQELQRQKMLDAQNTAKQQQEMQLKQKADARADQELQIHLQDTKVQRAMWTAQTMESTQRAQREAAMFPTLQKEAQLRAEELSKNIQLSEIDQKAILSAAGVDVSKLPLITDTKNATQSQIKAAGSGSIFPIQNGESHDAGEDKVGMHIVDGQHWEAPIKEPVKLISGWDVDPKTGKEIPKYTTAQPGMTVGDLLAVAKGAQKDLEQKKTALYDQAKLAHENAGTSKDIAEAGKANADASLARSQVSQGPQQDILGGTYTPPPGGIKELNKRTDSFKNDASDLAKTEGTFNQFNSVLNDINAGKDITGAQSVVALFNAIGISATPLKGMGMRINSNTVSEHKDAIGVDQRVTKFFEGLKNGEVVTPQQIKDYATIAVDARKNAYVNKINQVRAAGVDPSFLLPRGNGKTVDSNTAQIFYDTSGGATPQEKGANTLKALHQLGWK